MADRPPRVIGRGKRPTPEFPAEGFLGALPNLDGGTSTEWSVTIPHPTHPGFWTNVPTLFPGQQATSTIPGDQLTPEQWQRTQDFAQVLAQSGYDLPAFKTIEDAVFQAGHRHKALEGQPNPYPQGPQPGVFNGPAPAPLPWPQPLLQLFGVLAR